MKINLPKTPDPKAKAPPGPLDAPNATVSWKQLKADWLSRNLDPTREEKYTLKDVALEYSLSYNHVKKMASQNDWTKTLKTCKAQIEAEAAKKFIEGLAVSEADIRLRQHKVSAAMIEKAFAALQAIDPATISTKDATQLMRLGLTQERAAVGLADRIDFQDLSKPTHEDHESPLVKMELAKKKNQLADQLLAELDDDEDEDLEE